MDEKNPYQKTMIEKVDVPVQAFEFFEYNRFEIFLWHQNDPNALYTLENLSVESPT